MDMVTVIAGMLRCILAHTYNHVHKVLRLTEMGNFPSHHKWNKMWLLVLNWYIWVVERLKTDDLKKLGNIRKISKL